MLFHASPICGIKRLEPRVSNHGTPLLYLSSKRENTLVYLSNAVEKYCRETGFEHCGPWYKWASYGFTRDGRLCLDEYYPNATLLTYAGVSGYVYSVNKDDDCEEQADIPFAFVSRKPLEAAECEHISDAYEEIMRCAAEGLIVLRRYEDCTQKQLQWIKRTISIEYANASERPDYRHFLEAHFDIEKSLHPAEN